MEGGRCKEMKIVENEDSELNTDHLNWSERLSTLNLDGKILIWYAPQGMILGKNLTYILK